MVTSVTVIPNEVRKNQQIKYTLNHLKQWDYLIFKNGITFEHKK